MLAKLYQLFVILNVIVNIPQIWVFLIFKVFVFLKMFRNYRRFLRCHPN
jgi:hypothetical protein